jgi:hypothetical protein
MIAVYAYRAWQRDYARLNTGWPCSAGLDGEVERIKAGDGDQQSGQRVRGTSDWCAIGGLRRTRYG